MKAYKVGTEVEFMCGTIVERNEFGVRRRLPMAGRVGIVLARRVGRMDAECEKWVEPPRSVATDHNGQYMVHLAPYTGHVVFARRWEVRPVVPPVRAMAASEDESECVPA